MNTLMLLRLVYFVEKTAHFVYAGGLHVFALQKSCVEARVYFHHDFELGFAKLGVLTRFFKSSLLKLVAKFQAVQLHP